VWHIELLTNKKLKTVMIAMTTERPALAAPEKVIRILLVDDQEIVRVGLGNMLQGLPNLTIVGEAATMKTAIAETARLKPDVVLLDIRLPDGSGFEACRAIQALKLNVRVLFLTAFADDETVFEGIASGADGYIIKEIDRNRLARAIESVASGQSVLDPALVNPVMKRMRQAGEGSGKENLDILSDQQMRVLALVAEGKTNKEIAAVLGLSDKTIKNHISHVFDKLKLTRRSQAAAFFAQHSRPG
jgi:two-component system response regulator DevR